VVRNSPHRETSLVTASDVADATRAPARLGAQQAEGGFGPWVRKRLNEGIVRTLQTPIYLILFVSDRCWMKCDHCWFNEDWKKRELNHAPLVFDEYEKIARSIKQLPFLSITGGEAFSRSDIVELATMFRKTAGVKRHQIPTSGFLTDLIVGRAEAILQANPETPFRVDVSLDGVAEVHDRQRNIPGGFERTVETIHALNRLRSRYSHFDVGVISTITQNNQQNIDALGALVEQIHPDGEWMINIARGDGRDQNAVYVDPAAYARAHELIANRVARGAYKGHNGHWTAKWLSAKNAARRDIIFDIMNGGRFKGGCTAGTLGGVVQSDGIVKICEMIDEPMGDLRTHDYDLAAVWRGHIARKLRGQVQDTRCQCTQECFLSTSMLTSPDALTRIVRKRWELDRFGTVRSRQGMEDRTVF
jgi:MoaA/NifB/PqqE/SkfB family radical SAM enzyme